MKRAVIVHGWDGHPDECWFPWLKRELEERGYQVEVPQMPQTETPKMGLWVPKLAETIGEPDAELVLIGHSMGVQTIMRYLASVNTTINTVIAVAGFFTLVPLPPEEQNIVEPWLTTPIDTDAAKAHAQRIVAIFSDNDRYVPLANVELFQQRLAAETIVLNGRGHMGANDNALQLPEILLYL